MESFHSCVILGVFFMSQVRRLRLGEFADLPGAPPWLCDKTARRSHRPGCQQVHSGARGLTTFSSGNKASSSAAHVTKQAHPVRAQLPRHRRGGQRSLRERLRLPDPSAVCVARGPLSSREHTGLTRHYGRGAGKDPCRGSGVLPWGKGRGWETHRAPWLEQRSQGSRTDGIYLFFYLTRMEPCCPPSIVINALQNEHTGPQRGLRVAFLSPLPR